MIIDTTQTAIERQIDEDYHPDCCECPKCLFELYNPVYKIVRKTISGCMCPCGSVDFGAIAGGVITRNGSSFVCKQCNRWEWV